MTRLEMVEQIREKTGVTYDVAKETLETNNWDMLDAIIALDKPDFTAAREAKAEAPARKASRRQASETMGEFGSKLIGVIKYALHIAAKGEGIRMEIYRKDEFVESISITALVLLLLLCWWLPVGLVAVGLFTGFRFKFTGAGKLVNRIAEKTGDKAEEIKARISEDK